MKRENYSNLRTVFRVAAWIRRFIHNCRSVEKKQGELTAEELVDAEKCLILEAQGESYQWELSELRSGREIHKDSKIRDLTPQDGLLCVGGRLQQSDMSFSERHPRILPSNHRLSEMLIKYCHHQVMHAGMRDTLVQLRDKYWIPRARQMVKRMIASCTTCKRFTAKAAGDCAPTKRPHYRVTSI